MPQWIHDRAKHIQAKNPSMPESEAWAIATQQAHALGKSPKGYGTSKGRATAKNKYKTPEDDQKKAASVLVELTKQAFGVSQYSGPLNPVIASGASFQPPRKAPTLQRAIQKTAELWPGFFDELLKHANVNIGQWWEQVGGPHLARGGDHGTFKKMMEADGIPPAVQERFARVAQQRYKATPNAGGAPPHDPTAAFRRANQISMAIQLGVPLAIIGHHFYKKHKEKKAPGKQKAAAGAPTRGNFMMASDVPPFKAPRLDRAIQKDSAFGKEKDGDMLSDYVTYNPGDFKKSKYAMPMHELSAFVAELLEKDASIASPAAQLSKTQHVGAPKATAAPGPSIADIAKPKGAKFGIGIPGAFKTKL